MYGDIIKISRFCTDDGPGIRTVVFLKGCPLRCIWCHNPESQSRKPEIMYDTKKCIGCGQCRKVCANGCHTFRESTHTLRLENCTACQKCVDVCVSNALEIIGKRASADDVLAELEKDSVFYATSNGGVTISGGEPLYQPEFTGEILRLCKEKGIHTAIETSGYASREALDKALKYCDLVLFDIKETNEENHKKYTGVSSEPILKNLNTVNEMGIPFIIRLPVIPGLNDRDEHFCKVKRISKSMKFCKGIEVMPYHLLGAYKYELLRKEYLCSDIPEPDNKTADKWRRLVMGCCI